MTVRPGWSLLVAALFSLGRAGCGGPTAPPLETSTAALDPGGYTLGAGDKVRVLVFGQESLTGEYGIDGSGQLAMPLIGNVSAMGLTARQLEESVEQRLAAGYVNDPSVSVEVLTFRPFYIFGEVNKPGQYPYASGMTAVAAVAMAGGYTYRARTGDVVITRSIEGQRQERSASPTTPILPDDVIRIPERLF